jgi:hypothetical protein
MTFNIVNAVSVLSVPLFCISYPPARVRVPPAPERRSLPGYLLIGREHRLPRAAVTILLAGRQNIVSAIMAAAKIR